MQSRANQQHQNTIQLNKGKTKFDGYASPKIASRNLYVLRGVSIPCNNESSLVLRPATACSDMWGEWATARAFRLSSFPHSMESSVARCPGSVSFPPLSPDCTLSTRVHLAPVLLGPEALGAATHRSKFLLTWYHLCSRNAVQSLHPLGGRKRVFDGLTLYIVRWGPYSHTFYPLFPLSYCHSKFVHFYPRNCVYYTSTMVVRRRVY